MQPNEDMCMHACNLFFQGHLLYVSLLKQIILVLIWLILLCDIYQRNMKQQQLSKNLNTGIRILKCILCAAGNQCSSFRWAIAVCDVFFVAHHHVHCVLHHEAVTIAIDPSACLAIILQFYCLQLFFYCIYNYLQLLAFLLQVILPLKVSCSAKTYTKRLYLAK